MPLWRFVPTMHDDNIIESKVSRRFLWLLAILLTTIRLLFGNTSFIHNPLKMLICQTLVELKRLLPTNNWSIMTAKARVHCEYNLFICENSFHQLSKYYRSLKTEVFKQLWNFCNLKEIFCTHKFNLSTGPLIWYCAYLWAFHTTWNAGSVIWKCVVTSEQQNESAMLQNIVMMKRSSIKSSDFYAVLYQDV